MNKARSDCRSRLPGIVCSGGAWCDLPNPCDAYISARVTPKVNEFRRILDELDAAVNPDLSDAAARQALKAALTKLSDREVISLSSARVGVCTKPVLVCADFGIKVTVPARSQRILTAEQVDLLRLPRDNVDRIPTEPFPVTAGVYQRLLAALGTAPDACGGGTITDPGATAVGVVLPHGAGSPRFFYESGSGQREYVGEFNLFNPLS